MNSDVFAMYQSEVDGRIVPWDLLVKDVLPEHHRDLDYIVEMLDWEANINPNFGADNKRVPEAGAKTFGETDATATTSCGCATAPVGTRPRS